MLKEYPSVCYRKRRETLVCTKRRRLRKRKNPQKAPLCFGKAEMKGAFGLHKPLLPLHRGGAFVLISRFLQELRNSLKRFLDVLGRIAVGSAHKALPAVSERSTRNDCHTL